MRSVLNIERFIIEGSIGGGYMKPLSENLKINDMFFQSNFKGIG